jgi:hypothetical protein
MKRDLMRMISRTALVFVLGLMASAPLIGAEDAASEVARETSLPMNSEVSDGQRIAIDGKGFTIVAPQGWIVQKNLPRSSLYMQARVSGSNYPRNIGVVRFQDSVLINATTAEAFAEKIVKQFPTAAPTIEHYALRNHQSIQMADGREGILFYTDFDDSGQKMMQAHILVSSETNHYLVTFTDLAEHFENPSDSSQFFTDAWASMTSIQLDSPNPQPAMGVETVVLWVLGLATVFMSMTFIRKGLAAKMYRRYGNLDQNDGDDLETVSDVVTQKVLEVTTKPVTHELAEEATAAGTGTDPNSNSNSNAEAELDDGIRSPLASKILRFRKKRSSISDDTETADGAWSDSGEGSNVERKTLKKGA